MSAVSTMDCLGVLYVALLLGPACCGGDLALFRMRLAQSTARSDTDQDVWFLLQTAARSPLATPISFLSQIYAAPALQWTAEKRTRTLSTVWEHHMRGARFLQLSYFRAPTEVCREAYLRSLHIFVQWHALHHQCSAILTSGLGSSESLWSLAEVNAFFEEFLAPLLLASLLPALDAASKEAVGSASVEASQPAGWKEMDYYALCWACLQGIVVLVPFATRCTSWEVLLCASWLGEEEGREAGGEEDQRTASQAVACYWAACLTVPRSVLERAEAVQQVVDELKVCALTGFIAESIAEALSCAVQLVHTVCLQSSLPPPVSPSVAAAALQAFRDYLLQDTRPWQRSLEMLGVHRQQVGWSGHLPTQWIKRVEMVKECVRLLQTVLPQ